MMPLALLTRSKKQAEKYIADFIKKNAITPAAIFRYEIEKTLITIDQIREISNLFARHDPTHKLIIIYDFDTAKEPTQNALLKTLEEKSAVAQFIIVAKNEQSLLPTILSRVRVVRLAEDIKRELDINPFDEITTLFSEFSYIEKDSKKASIVCDTLLSFFNKKIYEMPGSYPTDVALYKAIPSIIKEILYVRTLIEKNNLGSQIAVDHLFLFIRKQFLHRDV